MKGFVFKMLEFIKVEQNGVFLYHTYKAHTETEANAFLHSLTDGQLQPNHYFVVELPNEKTLCRDRLGYYSEATPNSIGLQVVFV
jgi:hypothetical protein